MISLLDDNFKYLLDTYDYDQDLYPGPPHSVQMEEIQNLYGKILDFVLIFFLFV